MKAIKDETDRALLALLRRDARLPVSSLAATLGVSRATVQSRIDRLRQSGTIRGFTVDLGGAEEGGVSAITTIEIKGADLALVVEELRRIPEVKSVYSTNGRWDLVARLVADDLPRLDRAVGAIRRIAGVTSSETNILLTRL